MPPTMGEQFGITVSAKLDGPPELAQQIIARTFAQLWAAGRAYLAHHFDIYEIDDMSIDQGVLIRSAFMGSATQMAQTLWSGGAVRVLNRSLHVHAENWASSSQGLLTLVEHHWLVGLPAIDMTDQAWSLFFRAVRQADQGHDIAPLAEELAGLSGISPDASYRRIDFYANEVLPEWRRWHPGIDDPELPRM